MQQKGFFGNYLCPDCGHEVDIDRHNVRKDAYGNICHERCPSLTGEPLDWCDCPACAPHLYDADGRPDYSIAALVFDDMITLAERAIRRQNAVAEADEIDSDPIREAHIVSVFRYNGRTYFVFAIFRRSGRLGFAIGDAEDLQSI